MISAKLCMLIFANKHYKQSTVDKQKQTKVLERIKMKTQNLKETDRGIIVYFLGNSAWMLMGEKSA